jgi:hypothetical protein
MIKDIQTVLDNLVDVPSWEKDPDDPVPALAHQALIGIMSLIGIRSIMWDRARELLANHDNDQDFWTAWNQVQDEILDDLQRALHGTDFGKECEAHEEECSHALTVLRKESR